MKKSKKELKTVLGKPDSAKHSKWVRDLMEQRTFLIDQNMEFWANTVRWWKLYLAKMEDHRLDEQDQWRSKTFTPLPYVVVDTKSAVLHDIMTSVDPPIQAEGVGDEDVEAARGIEGLADYTLRCNQWRRKLAGMLTRTGIQGLEYYKLVWRNKTHEVTHYPDEHELKEFQKAVTEAFEILHIRSDVPGGWPQQVPHPNDPEAFEEWRQTVNRSGRARIPELPTSGRRQLVQYRGPWIDRLNLYDVYADPLVDEMTKQPVVMHRMVRTWDWVEKQIEKGVIDGAAAETCRGGPENSELTADKEQEINQLLGIKSSRSVDPRFKDAVEILEVWHGADTKVPYALVMNGQGVVNTRLELPYEHGQCAIGCVRNQWIPGYLHGISDLQEPESMFYEYNIMRNLRVDRTHLETFPVMQYQDMSLPPMKRRLRPGDLIRANRSSAIEPVMKYQSTHAFTDLDQLWNQIAEAATAYSHIRGAPTEVNRVSATESEGRRQQALTRLKIRAVGIEDELQPVVEQMLYLWYQKGDPQLRVKVVGEQHQDPFLYVSKSQLFQALSMDFRFRSATKALTRDVIVTQYMQFLKDNAQMMIPAEMRDVMRQVAELLGMKNIRRIVSPEGDQHFEMMHKLVVKQTQAQLMTPTQPPGGAPGGGPEGAPATVDPAMAAELEAEMTNGDPAAAPAPPVPA